MSYPSNILVIFFLVIIFGSLCHSCSNTQEQHISTDGLLVFDYKTDDSHPVEKMSVFISSDTNLPISKMQIINSDRTYEWNSDKISNVNNLYFCKNLCLPENRHFSKGKYFVNAFLLDGTKKTSSFFIDYPDYCIDSSKSIVYQKIKSDFQPISSKYDNNKLKNVISAQEISSCYISDNMHILCLLPDHSK